MDNGLLIERIFDASVQDVWNAWTNPENLMRWWGPETFTSPVCRMDFKTGGKYLFCMQSPNGEMFWSTGEYKEIIYMQKIVYTDSFSDKDGNVVSPETYGFLDFPVELLVTVTFEFFNDKTKLTLRQTGIPEGKIMDDIKSGWNGSFKKLAESIK